MFQKRKGYAFCPAPWKAESKSRIETDMTFWQNQQLDFPPL